jgi:hypothetical protein
VRIDALDILESSPIAIDAVHRPDTTRLVRTPPEHNPPTLIRIFISQLLNSLGDFSRRIETQHLFVPSPWVQWLIQITPVSQFSGGGRVDFFIERRTTIVFDAIFDSGDSEDKGEWENGDIRISRAENLKSCEK